MIANRISHVDFLFRQGGALKLFNHFRDNMLFDITKGTNTSSWLEKDEFKVRPENFEHGVRYRACASSAVRDALDVVSGMVDIGGDEYSYYDLGCGKGKTLIIADEEYDFKKVTGIDYYQPFIDQAQKNIMKRGLAGVDLLYKDMARFEGFAETSIVFLYNPAEEPVIDQVRKNLEANTKKAIVVYNKPVHSNIFDGWKLISRKTDADPDYNTDIYLFGD